MIGCFFLSPFQGFFFFGGGMGFLFFIFPGLTPWTIFFHPVGVIFAHIEKLSCRKGPTEKVCYPEKHRRKTKRPIAAPALLVSLSDWLTNFYFAFADALTFNRYCLTFGVISGIKTDVYSILPP